MNIFKKITILSLVAFLGILNSSGIVSAQATGGGMSAETTFGGQLEYSMYCSCSGNYLNYVYDYKTNSLLKLVYQEGASKLFQNYNVFTIMTDEMGSYIQGAGECQIEAGEDCVTISSDGEYGMMPGTGTTLSPVVLNTSESTLSNLLSKSISQYLANS